MSLVSGDRTGYKERRYKQSWKNIWFYHLFVEERFNGLIEFVSIFSGFTTNAQPVSRGGLLVVTYLRDRIRQINPLNGGYKKLGKQDHRYTAVSA